MTTAAAMLAGLPMMFGHGTGSELRKPLGYSMVGGLALTIVAVYADGSEIEMATIGREGCTGLQAVFGSKTSSVRLLVQIPGNAAKMSRRAFMRAVESMPSFRGLMFTYVEAFIEQVLVSVACNGAHSLKQLARWLLMMRDRSDGDILPITQNLLAEMLGVHRPSITNAIRLLERADSILAYPVYTHTHQC